MKPKPTFGQLMSSWVASVAEPKHQFAGVTLQGDTVSFKRESQPVNGVQAVVETAGELRKRSTITRTLGGGVLFGPAGAVVGALFRKKKDARELYLLIDGPKYAWVVEVSPSKGAAARKFAAAVNTAAK